MTKKKTIEKSETGKIEIPRSLARLVDTAETKKDRREAADTMQAYIRANNALAEPGRIRRFMNSRVTKGALVLGAAALAAPTVIRIGESIGEAVSPVAAPVINAVGPLAQQSNEILQREVVAPVTELGAQGVGWMSNQTRDAWNAIAPENRGAIVGASAALGGIAAVIAAGTVGLGGAYAIRKGQQRSQRRAEERRGRRN